MNRNRKISFSLLFVVLFLSVMYLEAGPSRIEPASSAADVNGIRTRRDARGRFDSGAAAGLSSTEADEKLRDGFKVLADRGEIVDFSIAALLDDPSVQWKQANPLAIEIDANANAWHSGRVNDVLALDSNRLVVGTDTGGVWLVSTTAIPLSNNWDNPDIKCLAFGPDGPEHIYAGCGGNGALFEADAADFQPLSTWRQRPIPEQAGAIYRIGIVKGSRRIVLACANGVWWSPIPPAPTRNANYAWRQAQELPSLAYSSLAVGPNDTIAVAAAQGGIFYGNWTAGDLVMRPADSITGFDVTNTPVSSTKMYWTSMASCDSNRSEMYAISSDNEGYVYVVLHSTDGGKSWSSTGISIDGAPNGYQFKYVPGNAGNGVNNTIAVSPVNPKLVAFGWRRGPFISTDGGGTWHAAGMHWTNRPNDPEYSTPHLHADLHGLYFDPNDARHQRLYIGSDGGLAMTPNLGNTFSSSYNRQLLSLQFYSASLPRNFWGMLAVTPQVAGLVAGGTQDNSNIYSQLEPQPSPWKHVGDCGDGGRMAFLPTGNLLASCTTDDSVSRVTRWTGAQFGPVTEVPIRVTGPSGLAKLDGGVIEAVNAPAWRNAGNQLIYAVAGRNAEVYGLFANGDGGDMHWEFLGLVPVGAGQYILAVGSRNGLTIFVGTSEGRTFAFETQSRNPVELNVPIKAATTGSIGRIVAQSTDRVYATLNLGSIGFILRLDGFHWNAVAFVQEIFYALEMDRTTKVLFAATDSRVYLSRDNGDSWQSASHGLPRRPHCADLRFVAQPDGARYVYLSTYGRSVWRAKL